MMEFIVEDGEIVFHLLIKKIPLTEDV
jgi:hypothetical protein